MRDGFSNEEVIEVVGWSSSSYYQLLEMDTDCLYMAIVGESVAVPLEDTRRTVTTQTSQKKSTATVKKEWTVRGMLFFKNTKLFPTHHTRWESFEDNRRGIGRDNNQYQWQSLVCWCSFLDWIPNCSDLIYWTWMLQSVCRGECRNGMTPKKEPSSPSNETSKEHYPRSTVKIHWCVR